MNSLLFWFSVCYARSQNPLPTDKILKPLLRLLSVIAWKTMNNSNISILIYLDLACMAGTGAAFRVSPLRARPRNFAPETNRRLHLDLETCERYCKRNKWGEPAEGRRSFCADNQRQHSHVFPARAILHSLAPYSDLNARNLYHTLCRLFFLHDEGLKPKET